MSDLVVRLQDNPHLLDLLAHYARPGSGDREAWRDRVMNMDGVVAERLSALHGELIALDAVEQNTGHAVLLPDGTLSACYRVTPAGMREFRRLHGVEAAGKPPEAAETPPPRPPRRKKERAAASAAAASG